MHYLCFFPSQPFFLSRLRLAFLRNNAPYLSLSQPFSLSGLWGWDTEDKRQMRSEDWGRWVGGWDVWIWGCPPKIIFLHYPFRRTVSLFLEFDKSSACRWHLAINFSSSALKVLIGPFFPRSSGCPYGHQIPLPKVNLLHHCPGPSNGVRLTASLFLNENCTGE